MADEYDPHRVCVAVWLRGIAQDTPRMELVELFERALGALWRRAQVTLGDVTLAAIVDRVLYTASARVSCLRVLEVDASGVGFDELKKRAPELDRDELARGMRVVLVEFLTVLGHLTAEILTPALHAELSQVVHEPVQEAEPERQALREVTEKKLVRRS